MKKFVSLLLGCWLLSVQLFAQSRTITGKVTDESGNPIPNASVTVRGSSRGTTTNESGNYSLSVPENVKALIISSVGMEPYEVPVGNKGIINASLAQSKKGLEEIVVVGYGTQKRIDVTGSVSMVKAADIENKPFTSVDKALQGEVAGLQSVSSSGAPGANQQIRIRGISSITANNQPLWVIDGVPINTGDASRLTTSSNLLSTLNPNDIESVSVLKDAASESIYGSRAANGVIVVTTKRGKAGVTKFRFDAEAGQSSTAYTNPKYKPLNASDYLAITKEGLINNGNTQTQIDATLASLGNGNGTDFNWLDATTRKGSQQQYNLSASGGNDKTTFYLSGGYFRQDGTVIASNLERYNSAIRITNKATNRLTLNMNIDGGAASQHSPLNGGAFGNPVLASYFLLPTRSAYKADGTYNILTSDFPTSGTFNPVALASMDKRLLKQFSLRGSASAEYAILQNLKFKSSFGADYNTLEEDQYNNPLYGDGYTTVSSTTGRAYAYYTRYSNWIWTNTLNFHQNINKSGDIYFDAQAGYESQLSKGYFTSAQGTGFPPTLLLQYPIVSATPKTATATISDYSFISQFASVAVNYKDRFIASGSFRRDGSSRFGANNRYGNFWSVGGSWNVNNEAFMKDIEVINQLKIRASYGVNGNAGIGNYDWYPGYGYGANTTLGTNYNYNSAPGSAPNNVGDSNLTWELNKPFNVGVDVSILKNRVSFTADYYNRKSTDLLLSVQLSRTSGFSSATRNIGAMENKGIELTLNLTPVLTKNFKWDVDFNYAHNINKVTNLPNHADIASPTSSVFNIREGYDVQTFFVRRYAGVDPANGDPLWYSDSSMKSTTNVYPAASTRVMYASASPKYFGALTNRFNYKGISLEVQLYYNFGNYIQDLWGSYYVGAGFGATFNKVQRVLDRWQKPGDITDIPKYVYGGNKSFSSTSSFYLNKGDFIRLRNIQLGYTIPKSILSKAKISNAFIYVRGTNLATWVGDKNLPFDPEQGVASQSNLDVFIPKTMTAGLTLGF